MTNSPNASGSSVRASRRPGRIVTPSRQRAKRGQWARRKDNMGRMQVGVPTEALEPPPERVRERPPEGDHERVLGADISAFIARQIERLEAAVEAAQAGQTHE